MELMHYSAEPLLSIYSTEQIDEFHRHEKPRGLWVSVKGDDDWPSWCEAEQFGLSRLLYETPIVLVSDAPILTIGSVAALDAFSLDFGLEYQLGSFTNWAINWQAVADAYSGIIIAPYHWRRRLDGPETTGWYYGWDCASGCIWDAEAVKSLGKSIAYECEAA